MNTLTRNPTKPPTLPPTTSPPKSSPPTSSPPMLATIATDKTEYFYNEPIRVTFSNSNPSSVDWVGLYGVDSDLRPTAKTVRPGSEMWLHTCNTKEFSCEPMPNGELIFGPGDPDESNRQFWPLDYAQYNGTYKVFFLCCSEYKTSL